MKVEILTIFFGAEHLEMFFKTMVPSLYLKSNVPAMLADGVEVVHRIYCPSAEARSLSLYGEWSKIPVEIMPGTVAPENHDGLSVPVKESVQRKTLTVMAPCDHVFGNGLWRTIKDLKEGDYMVCGHPRIHLEHGLFQMEKFLREPRDDSNVELVKFCMEEIPHPMVTHGKRTPEPYWHAHNRGTHWEAHFAEPPPLAFWGSEYMMDAWTGFVLFGPWEVIDHEMVQHCFLRERLKWVDDSRQFFWAEFTRNKTYNPSLQPPLQSSFRYDCMRHFRDLPLRWYYNHER